MGVLNGEGTVLLAAGEAYNFTVGIASEHVVRLVRLARTRMHRHFFPMKCAALQ